jgi:hypothetical protein
VNRRGARPEALRSCIRLLALIAPGEAVTAQQVAERAVAEGITGIPVETVAGLLRHGRRAGLCLQSRTYPITTAVTPKGTDLIQETLTHA